MPGKPGPGSSGRSLRLERAGSAWGRARPRLPSALSLCPHLSCGSSMWENGVGAFWRVSWVWLQVRRCRNQIAICLSMGLSASPCPSWACTAYMGLWANLSVTTGGLEEQEAWVHARIWGGLPGSRTGVQNSRKGDSPDTSRALTGPDVLWQGGSPSAWMLPAQGWGTGGLISLQHPVTRPGEAWPLQALPGPPSQH